MMMIITEDMLSIVCIVLRLNLRGLKRILCILLNESDEALQRTIAVIINKLATSSFLELERWETRDPEVSRSRNVVFGSLHLGTVNAKDENLSTL